MRASQRVLLAALGAVVLVTVASLLWVRINISPAVELSGQRTTLTPALTDFDGLTASGSWELTVQQGDSWRVEVDVPLELAERLEARVENANLILGLNGGVWLGGFGDQQLAARITMPRLSSLRLSGAGQVEFSGFAGERLDLVASGAAELDGKASRFDTLTVSMSGAGEANLRDVTVTDADVSMSGAGELTLTMAGGRLTGRMSGAGELTYYGTVTEESVTTSGAADVRHAD